MFYCFDLLHTCNGWYFLFFFKIIIEGLKTEAFYSTQNSFVRLTRATTLFDSALSITSYTFITNSPWMKWRWNEIPELSVVSIWIKETRWIIQVGTKITWLSGFVPLIKCPFCFRTLCLFRTIEQEGDSMSWFGPGNHRSVSFVLSRNSLNHPIQFSLCPDPWRRSISWLQSLLWSDRALILCAEFWSAIGYRCWIIFCPRTTAVNPRFLKIQQNQIVL